MLYIESDHLGLTSLVHLSSHYILLELKKRVGEMKITALRFTIKKRLKASRTHEKNDWHKVWRLPLAFAGGAQILIR